MRIFLEVSYLVFAIFEADLIMDKVWNFNFSLPTIYHPFIVIAR
jgi:hypothetical protein